MKGIFTETVIPRSGIKGFGLRSARPGKSGTSAPVGSHPEMTNLLLQRAQEIAPNVPLQEISLLIVAHGTELNDQSAVAAEREVEKIRALNRYASVLNVYMEEAPLVSDWKELTTTSSVVVVPFFISDGLHSYPDIPDLLGIDEVLRNIFDQSAPPLRRTLYYASAIGADPRIADIILEQVAAFDRSDCVPPSPAQSPGPR